MHFKSFVEILLQLGCKLGSLAQAIGEPRGVLEPTFGLACRVLCAKPRLDATSKLLLPKHCGRLEGQATQFRRLLQLPVCRPGVAMTGKPAAIASKMAFGVPSGKVVGTCTKISAAHKIGLTSD